MSVQTGIPAGQAKCCNQVPVEKVPLSQDSQNFGIEKCLRKQRKSFVGILAQSCLRIFLGVSFSTAIGVFTSLRPLFAFSRLNECNGDVSPAIPREPFPTSAEAVQKARVARG